MPKKRLTGCNIKDCNRRHHADGLCRAHYQWLKRYGEVETDPDSIHVCRVDDCRRKHCAKGLCRLHYDRWRRTGTSMVLPTKRPKRCLVKGCGKPVNALCLCPRHEYQMRQHGYTWLRLRAKHCTVKGCNHPHYGQGLCRLHYDRLWAYGRTTRVLGQHGATCTVKGCGRTHHAKGLCGYHYKKKRKRQTQSQS